MHVPVGIGFTTIRRKSWSHVFGPPGIRRNNDGSPRQHDGWDIACFVGSPVHAILSGTVARVERGKKLPGSRYWEIGYANHVILKVDHKGTTYFAMYAHLSGIDVVEGQEVGEGDVFGRSGNSGYGQIYPDVEDEHLHFEIRGGLHGPTFDPGLLLGYGAIGDVLRAEIREALNSPAKTK